MIGKTVTFGPVQFLPSLSKNRARPDYARNLPVLTGLPTIGSSWVTKPYFSARMRNSPGL